MDTHDRCSRETDPGCDTSGHPDGAFLGGENCGPLSVEEALDLLAHDHRRTALRYLKQRPSRSVPLERIVAEIATRERPGSVDDVDRDARTSVEVLLRHQHLPKLERAGVISFDEGAEAVTYRGDRVVEAYLDVTDEIEG